MDSYSTQTGRIRKRGRRRSTRLLAAMVLSAVACGDGATESVEPTGTPDTVIDVVGAPLTYFAQRFASGSVNFVQRVETASWVVAGEAGIRRVTSSTVVSLEGDAGVPRAAAIADGVLVVASADGLFVAQQGRLQASPLGEGGELQDVAQMAVTSDGALWLSAADGLHVREADGLWRLDVPGMQGRPLLAPGRTAQGEVLWVAAERSVFALSRVDGRWVAEIESSPEPVAEMVADAAGRLWIRSPNGTLVSRSASGQWTVHEAVSNVTQLAADVRDSILWLRSDDAVYRFDGASFRPVGGPAEGRLAVAADGVMLAGPDGLYRYVADRRVDIVGISEGTLVNEPARVVIRPSSVDTVTSIALSLDGASLPIGSDDPSIVIDPAVLADGEHALVATVTFQDAAPVEVTRTFAVLAGPAPTWVDDIEPLFKQHCALCHDAQGSARILEEPQSWIDLIDTVLFNVRTGRMPLPPNPTLTPDEVARVEGWKAAGFPLSRE